MANVEVSTLAVQTPGADCGLSSCFASTAAVAKNAMFGDKCRVLFSVKLLRQRGRWLAPIEPSAAYFFFQSPAAIQTCLSMKVLFGMALRQTTGFVESLLRLADLDWTVPDLSTLSRRQKTLAVKIPYQGSNGPLHLLIPSRDIAAQCPAGQWTHPCYLTCSIRSRRTKRLALSQRTEHTMHENAMMRPTDLPPETSLTLM
jgi:hypothetical protein